MVFFQFYFQQWFQFVWFDVVVDYQVQVVGYEVDQMVIGLYFGVVGEDCVFGWLFDMVFQCYEVFVMGFVEQFVEQVQYIDVVLLFVVWVFEYVYCGLQGLFDGFDWCVDQECVQCCVIDDDQFIGLLQGSQFVVCVNIVVKYVEDDDEEFNDDEYGVDVGRGYFYVGLVFVFLKGGVGWMLQFLGCGDFCCYFGFVSWWGWFWYCFVVVGLDMVCYWV